MAKETAKLLVEKDLKQGDILLFSPARDTESQLIAKLTNSEVTHAAMMYYDMGELTEEMPPYASKSPLKKRLKDTYKDVTYDRTLHVMRLTDEWVNKNNIESMTPVLKRADLYMEEKVPYSYESLVIMGLYTVIRKLLPKKHLKSLTRLLQVATVELAKIVNDAKFKGVKPFVCSQYVFNCYYTADESTFPYALQLKPGTLDSSLLTEMNAASTEDVSRLNITEEDTKLIQERIENTLKNVAPELLTQEGIGKFVESFVEEISKEVVNEVKSLDFNHDDHQDFVKAAHDFFALLVKTYDLNVDSKHVTPLEKVYAFQEFFVTPQDMLKNMENLYNVGIIDNKNIK